MSSNNFVIKCLDCSKEFKTSKMKSEGETFYCDQCGCKHITEYDEANETWYPARATPLEALTVSISTAIDGVKTFFEGDYFSITDTAALSEIDTDRMQKQDGDDCKPFDHCFVDQNGGGITGDDFHGVVYFHIDEKKYLVVDY